MATKIGSVYVEVGADASDLGKDVTSQLEKQMKPAGRQAGEKFAGNFGTWATKAVKAGAIGVGVAAATSLVAGINSGLKQQTATLVLSGLYDDAEVAKETIKGLNEVAANSPLNADAFQEGAASLAYAGVKGNDVVKIMENVGKSIVAVGGDSQSINQVSDAMLSMVNKGKVDLNDLNRISAAGVPIFSTLADTMNLSMEEVRELGSEGKISLEQVVDILRDAPGETFAASLRAGEEAARSLGNQTKIFWGNLTTTIGERLQPMIEGLTPAFEKLAGVAVPIANTLMDGFEGFLKVLRFISPVLLPVVTVLGTFFTLVAIKTGVMYAYNFALGASVGLWKALTSAMKANPILLVVSLLVALGAALVVAYKKSETFRNFVDKTWEVVKRAFSAAWDFLQPIFEVLWNWLGDILPGVFSVLWTSVKATLTPIKLLFQAWWAYTKFIFSALASLISNVVIPAIMWLWENAIKPVFTWIGDLVSTVWDSYLQPIFEAIGGWIMDTLVPAFLSFWEDAVKPAWEGFAEIVDAVWEGGIEPIFAAISTWLTETLGPALVWFYDTVIVPVWNGIKTVISVAWTVIKAVFTAVKWTVEKVLGPIFTWLWNTIIKPVWSGIESVIKVAWKVIKGIFQAIKSFIDNILAPVFTWLWENVIVPVWDGIKKSIDVVWAFLRDYVFKPLGKFVGETIPNAFTAGKDLAVAAWDKIKSPLESTWNFLKDKIFDPLKKLVKETIPSAFESAKKSIKSAWDGVKSIAAKPVNFLINTVYNSGIRRMWNAVATKFGAPELSKVNSVATFAQGGAVYGPGGPKDDLIPALLSNQEHVWTAAEVQGAGGHGQVQMLRQLAKAGQIPTFAEGGWWAQRWSDVKSVASGGWNSIKNVASHLADPIAWIKSGIDKIIGGIGSSGFSSMLRKIPGKVLDALKTKVTDIFAADGGPHAAGLAGPLSAGGWRRPASGPVTSEFGPRSMFGSNFHAGIDLGGTMPTYAARAGRVTATGGGILAGHTGQGILISHGGGYTTYYGHNPFGGIRVRPGQAVEGGQRVGQGGSTGNVTGPHLHFGLMKNGAFLNPRTMGVFDGGGWLEPKMLGFNAGKEPEAVLTPLQSRTLTEIANAAHLSDPLTRLDRDDLDYLADRISEELWPMARSADMVNDLAALGQNRRRRGSDR